MQQFPSTIFVALGVITAAILTGIFTFVNLIISKEQKTSEFRQNWINELRNEITIFVSSLNTFTNYINYLDDTCKTRQEFQDKSEEFVNSNIDISVDILKHYNSIKLRLNPKDDTLILKVLSEINELIESGNLVNEPNAIDKKSDELINESQKLLKKEWKRVKRGELGFFITKWIAFIIIALSVYGVVHNWSKISEFISSIAIVG